MTIRCPGSIASAWISDRVAAVFQVISVRNRGARQFAFLPYHGEAAAEFERQRRRCQENREI